LTQDITYAEPFPTERSAAEKWAELSKRGFYGADPQVETYEEEE
jgi:hypothetical protein